MKCRVISAPYHLGRPGIGMGNGPVRMLDAGLLEGLEAAGHGADLTTILLDFEPANEIIASFELQRRVAVVVAEAVGSGLFPVTLSGNCNTAAGGTVAGLPGEIGVVWLDAHADFSTPEITESGFVDGMGLSILTGACWKALYQTVPGYQSVAEENIILIGTRDISEPERARLDHSAVTVLSGQDAADGGLAKHLSLMRARVDRVYLHIDLDVLDPAAGIANAWAAPDGMHVAEIVDVIRITAAYVPLAGAGIASYDPIYDEDGALARLAGGLVRQIVEAAGQR